MKLRELKIPPEVEVVHGNVPGAFHRWNDKKADKAAAQISVRPDVKLVTEVIAYIEQRAKASVPEAGRGDFGQTPRCLDRGVHRARGSEGNARPTLNLCRGSILPTRRGQGDRRGDLHNRFVGTNQENRLPLFEGFSEQSRDGRSAYLRCPPVITA